MRKLVVFNQVTLDGYIADVNGDMSWAHKQDAEWNAFVAGNAKGEGELLFGRITYELMASFWPTPYAMENVPVVAEWMNNAPKVVFSRTLEKASWNNTRLVKGSMAVELRRIDALFAIAGSPVVAINRALAVAEMHGAGTALEAMHEVAADGRLAEYQPYWAARAELLAKTGAHGEARRAYEIAIGLERDPAIRRFLQRRQSALPA